MTKYAKLLHEAGITRWPSGWRKPISTGLWLTSAEQELNRKGGWLYGQTERDALSTQLEEFDQDLQAFGWEYDLDDMVLDEAVRDEIIWIKSWTDRARSALSESPPR